RRRRSGRGRATCPPAATSTASRWRPGRTENAAGGPASAGGGFPGGGPRRPLAGPAAHPLDVEQDHGLGLDAQPAAQRELGQRLVHRLAGGADELGELLLGEVVVHVQPVLALLAELV